MNSSFTLPGVLPGQDDALRAQPVADPARPSSPRRDDEARAGKGTTSYD
jgi:hypothetical protein